MNQLSNQSLSWVIHWDAITSKQAEKLKSHKMKEGWMKNDIGWWFQAIEGFCRLTDERTDICECRVAFETEILM